MNKEEKNLVERLTKQNKMLIKRINDLELDNEELNNLLNEGHYRNVDNLKLKIRRLHNTNEELKTQINEIIDCIKIDLNYTPCNCRSCKFLIKSYKHYHISDNADMRKFGEKDKCVLNPRLMNIGYDKHISCPLKR